MKILYQQILQADSVVLFGREKERERERERENHIEYIVYNVTEV